MTDPLKPSPNLDRVRALLTAGRRPSPKTSDKEPRSRVMPPVEVADARRAAEELAAIDQELLATFVMDLADRVRQLETENETLRERRS